MRIGGWSAETSSPGRRGKAHQWALRAAGVVSAGVMIAFGGDAMRSYDEWWGKAAGLVLFLNGVVLIARPPGKNHASEQQEQSES